MKKSIFSLVAMLAFGSFAMANNHLDVETPKSVKFIKVSERIYDDCFEKAIKAYECAIGDGEDDLDFFNMLVNYYCHGVKTVEIAN